MKINFIVRNIKKIIFFFLTLINFSAYSNALALEEIVSSKKLKYSNNIKWTKLYQKQYKSDYKNSNFENLKDPINPLLLDRGLRNINSYDKVALMKNSLDKEEIEIKSQIQYEKNNILHAEGKVLASYKGYILEADNITYDKTNKTVNAKGNVSLVFGEQILTMDSFKYDFNNKKGSLLKVRGLLKTSNLIEDLYSNFETSDIKNLEILKKIKKEKVLYTPNKIENWSFFTDKIQIDGDKWFSRKAIFTNDLLELNQVKFQINSLEAISRSEELRFKSSLNFLILDEKILIPFWFGNRTLTKSGEGLDSKKSWNIGYDNLDKDGFFIGRAINSISLSDYFVLDLEPQFLVQRSVKGYTKSFASNGDPITEDKVKRDTTFLDYLALNSQIKGKIDKWNLEIDNQIYSFDSEKFSNAYRIKANLNREIHFLNSKWDKSFYGVFRDRIWNGSIGEAEIYKGFGSKLDKQNTWEVNGIKRNESLSMGLANLRGESLNSANLVTSLKGNFFYSLDQNIPIKVDKPSSKYIETSYQYIPEPITKGISLNTKIEFLYSFYERGNSQGYLGFGAGPEYIIGDFKKKSFDYTRISLLPVYKIKEGDSIFKFDQISDEFILDIAFDQQLLGPLMLKSIGTLNLENNSKDYGNFINSRISLNWKKRSYEFGVFYQPHNKSGGIAFNLFGFE